MKEFRIGKMVLTRDLMLFMVASALLGVTTAVESSSFANRLLEDLNFTITQRTLLEIPRELPGLLVVFFAGALAFLGDVRTAAVANIIGGVGLLAFGLVPSGYWPVVFTMVLYSTGQHLYMPIQGALAMSFAKGDNIGRRLGEIQGINTAAMIVTAATLYLLYRFLNIPFVVSFSIGAAAMLMAGVAFLFMSPSHTAPRKQRFIYRKKFKLYYVLSIINGARKQITITFVPWLLITVYNQPVSTITMLFFIVSALNVFFRPWLGGLIDRKGERFVLTLEAGLLLVACCGFAFAKLLFPESVALMVVCGCYIIDNLFAGAGMARTTYVRRMTDDPSEVSATLSLGISLDHVISMSMPAFAGILWSSNVGTGYVYVFAGGLVISLLNMLLANRIRIGSQLPRP
ncbi:MAG: MFS transporter [Oscillospiraceae bacterium]|nr:MFS transporter [Oscillospiraceae bacterium]